MNQQEYEPVGEEIENTTELQSKIEAAKVPVSLSLMPGGKVERKRGPKWNEGENYKTGSENRRLGMEALIEWEVTPKSEREPKTKQALADLLGVTTETLRNWAKDPHVQRQIGQRIRNQAKVEKASDVINALFETATDVGNSRQVAAAKVWLDWVDRKQEEISAEELAELTDAELLEVVADLHDLIEERTE